MKLALVDKVGSTSLEPIELSWADLTADFGFKTVADRENEPLLIGWEFKELSDPEAAYSGVFKDGSKFNQSLQVDLEELKDQINYKWYSRCDLNTIALNLLILDVDNQADKGLEYWSYEDAVEYVKGLGIAALFYSSYNHRNKDKDNGVDKFRVLIPFKNACPKAEFKKRLAGLRELFPSAASESWKTSQPFYMPLQHPDRVHLSQSTLLEGDLFDWTLVPEDTIEQKEKMFTANSGDVINEHTGKYIKATDGREMTALEWYHTILEGYDHRVPCYSTERAEKNASSYFKKEGRFIKLFDGGTRNWTKFECVLPTPTLQLVVKKHDLVSEAFDKGSPSVRELDREEVQPHKRKFQAIKPYHARRVLIQTALSDFLDGDKKHMVLNTPEGYGKSTVLVESLVNRGHDVLFCCSSNTQADEKAQEFQKYGATRAISLSALFEKTYGFKPISTLTDEAKEKNPWAIPTFDDKQNIAELVERGLCDLEEAQEQLEHLKIEAAQSKRSLARVLVCTFATGAQMFEKSKGCLNRVIIVDDPSTNDFCTAHHKAEEDEIVYTGGQLIAERKVETLPFGPEFEHQDKVIFTTTETLTTLIIQKQHPDVLVKEIQEDIATYGNVAIFPSKMAWKDLRPILPGIHKDVLRANKEPILLFGNALKSDEEFVHNLVSSKGKNNLKSSAVIVISSAPLSAAYDVCRTLDIPYHEQNRILQIIASDNLDQALGRAQGYRWEGIGRAGFRTLVICDPKLALTLMWNSRYELRDIKSFAKRGKLLGNTMEVNTIPDWWAQYISLIKLWEHHTDKVGGKVIEFTSLAVDGDGVPLSQDERKRLFKTMDAHAKSVDMYWQVVTEMFEPESERKNSAVVLHELMTKKDKEAKKRPHLSAVRPDMKGKMVFVNNEGLKHVAKVGEKIPLGFDFKNKRLKTQYTITRNRTLEERK